MLLYDYRGTRLEEHVVSCSVKVEEYEVPSLKDELILLTLKYGGRSVVGV